MARWRVGVDSGGTFTDICLFDEEARRVALLFGAVATWMIGLVALIHSFSGGDPFAMSI